MSRVYSSRVSGIYPRKKAFHQSFRFPAKRPQTLFRNGEMTPPIHLVSEEATDKRQAATAAAGQIEYILFLLFPLDFDKKVLPAWAGADKFFAVCTRLNTKGMLRAQKHVLQYRTWAEVAQTSSGSNLHTFSHFSFREGGEASPLMLMILLSPPRPKSSVLRLDIVCFSSCPIRHNLFFPRSALGGPMLCCCTLKAFPFFPLSSG